MALSDSRVYAMAKALAEENRAQDTALIRQLVEALESATSFTSRTIRDRHAELVAAARAHLKEAP